MNMRFKSLLFSLLCLAAYVQQASAQANLSVQGTIQKSFGAAVDDGEYSLTFKLYTVDAGGTPVWSETQDAVSITGGVYSVVLGIVEPLTAAFDQPYFLGVTVDGGTELVPRARLTSSPYALSLIGQDNTFPSTGNVGVGTAAPTEKLHVLGDTKLEGNLEITGTVTGGIDLSNLSQNVTTTGNINGNNIAASGTVTATGTMYAQGKQVTTGEAAYRIVRGRVDANGGILTGEGFTCSSYNFNSQGYYLITFNTAFVDTPSVVATPENGSFATQISVHVWPESTNKVRIYTVYDAGPTAIPQPLQFSFIAVGKR